MLEAVAIVVLLLATLLWLDNQSLSYWAARGVPTVPNTLPFVGHLHKIFSRTKKSWEFMEEVYTKHGGSKYAGFYESWKPVLMVGDPDLLKQILVKDFNHFTNRRPIPRTKDSIFGEMLGNLEGEAWMDLRAVMTPAFSSGKLEGLFHLVCEKADALVAFSLNEAKTKKVIDMKYNFGRFTMDTIASCAFGIECDSLVNQDAEFPNKADAIFSFSSFSIIKNLRFIFTFMFPSFVGVLGLKTEADEFQFFRRVVEETISARTKGNERGDLMDLLLEAKKNNEESANPVKEVLSPKSIVAQCVLFLVAGFDSTASTLFFSAYLLSKHEQQQQRLRQELQQLVKEQGEITYESIMESKHLEACILETLRLFPPAFCGERVCSKDYKLPGTELVMNPGHVVSIPFWSIHHDARYWNDPEEFRPDRFMPENKNEIVNFTFMPFGMGPRNCIAMRFALLETKVALAKMILASKLQLAPGSEVMELENSPFLMRPRKGVSLMVTPLGNE